MSKNPDRPFNITCTKCGHAFVKTRRTVYDRPFLICPKCKHHFTVTPDDIERTFERSQDFADIAKDHGIEMSVLLYDFPEPDDEES